jgi:DeoR/GlpR family transcriptional regulator of sugar metabolism
VNDKINRVLQRVFYVPLEKTLTTFPTFNIQVKKSCAEKKKKKLFTKDKSLFGRALTGRIHQL